MGLSKLMRMGRVCGMIWIMVCLRACWVFTFTLLMHYSCKFVVLSRLICLHLHGFVVKEEIGLKASGTSGRVNIVNAHGQFDGSISCGTAP